jgi:hypothetical protein
LSASDVTKQAKWRTKKKWKKKKKKKKKKTKKKNEHPQRNKQLCPQKSVSSPFLYIRSVLDFDFAFPIHPGAIDPKPP